MPWGACGAIDFREIHQPMVHKCAHRGQVPDGAPPADGKSCVGPHGLCVGSVQWLTCKGRGAGHIDLTAARRDEQIDRACVCPRHNDRLGNLIKRAICGISGLLGCARL